MKLITLSILSLTLLSGCLQTRSDVRTGEQRQVLQQQVGTLQKTNADVNNRIADLEEQIRYQNGRIEVLENKLSNSNNENESLKRSSVEANQTQNQKMAIFQEALGRMEQNVNQLQAELAATRSQAMAEQTKRENQKAVAAAEASKNPFEAGENYFDKKEYKSAILEYQKYREKNAKGKNFATATYKMGLSFLEIGMKDEAKTFFDEVVSKFPKSEEARKAKSRLQKLK